VKHSLNFDGAGVLGMARTDQPDTNGSQFFITFAAQPSLDQKYTVWGKVLTGLDVLPKIVRGEPPTTPTRISRVTIGAKAK
jgi:peptidylprolyl isomerase